MTSPNDEGLTECAGNVNSAADLKVQPNIAQPSSCASKCTLGYIQMPEVRTSNEESGTASCASILESVTDSSAPICLSESSSLDEISNTFVKDLFKYSNLVAPTSVLCISNSSVSDVNKELNGTYGTKTKDYVTPADTWETINIHEINKSFCIDHITQHNDFAFNYI